MSRQRLDELHIAINSKCGEINKLIEEYDSLGGTVNYVNLLNFGDNGIRTSVVGMSSEVGNMVLSDEDLMFSVLSRLGEAISSEE